MNRLRATFFSLLGDRRLPAFLAVLAVVLVLPSLWTGLQLDDFYHWYFLGGRTSVDGRILGANDLFNFLDGDPARRASLLDAGVIPWWTSPELRVAFWRPLSGLTHRLDYLLWPDHPWLMHAQNLAWLAGAIVLATLLYRRVNAGVVAAGLAALFFAIDDAHGLPAGWLANRNALIAAFFGFSAILAHLRWRAGGNAGWMALGTLSWAAALLSGEIAIGAGAYLFAYAVCLERGGLRTRAASLAPYAVVFAGWLVFHTLAGYGAHGSGFYVDPAHEPVRFLLAVVENAPVLLADQFGLPPSAIQLFLGPWAKVAIWLWAVAFAAALVVSMRPLLARDATARFWALGALLSIPLVCTTIPNGRLLWFAGLGAFGLLGTWLSGHVRAAAGDAPPPRRRGFTRALFVFFVVVHGVIAPAALPFNAIGSAISAPYVQGPASRMKFGDGLAGKTLVFVNAPLYFYAQLIPTVLEYQGQAAPAAIRVLAPGPGVSSITRVSATSLLVRRETGWLDSPFDNVFRDVRDRMKVGETLRTGGMTVGIRAATPDGRPSEVVFRFDVPLEDSSLVWVRWNGTDYVRYEPPPPGSTSTTVVPPLY